MSQWWISALAAFAVIAIVVAVIVVSRFTRMMKMKYRLRRYGGRFLCSGFSFSMFPERNTR